MGKDKGLEPGAPRDEVMGRDRLRIRAEPSHSPHICSQRCCREVGGDLHRGDGGASDPSEGSLTLSVGQQLFPCLVGLLDDAGGESGTLRLAPAAEFVLIFSLGGLVIAEPVSESRCDAWHVSVQVGEILDVGGPVVIQGDGQDLPIGLVGIDHGDQTDDLDTSDGASWSLTSSELNDIDGIVVARAASFLADHLGVLPGLGEAAIIEEHVTPLVLAENTVLHILLDGVQVLTGGNLELLSGPLGDLADEVERSIGVLEGNVVPRGKVASVLSEVNTVSSRSGVSLGIGGDPGRVGVLQSGLEDLEALSVSLLGVVSLRVGSAVVESTPPSNEHVESDNQLLSILCSEELQHVGALFLINWLSQEVVDLENIIHRQQFTGGRAQSGEHLLHCLHGLGGVSDDHVLRSGTRGADDDLGLVLALLHHHIFAEVSSGLQARLRSRLANSRGEVITTSRFVHLLDHVQQGPDRRKIRDHRGKRHKGVHLTLCRRHSVDTRRDNGASDLPRL
mmetsp:Transcript_47629/g.101966  ORF Transcript_47629/g.101966 Transcript_47629/m.101966 type:complete len:507 (+) Transcript_47629:191-1711(+)